MASRRIASLVALAAAASAQLTIQLDPFGDNSIRVRVAPPGAAITDPPLQALLETPPSTRTAWERAADGSSLSNGNLRVDVDPSTGFLTATRLSDQKVLLQQYELTFGPPAAPGARPGAVSVTTSFDGHGDGEKVYGLGEHRTGSVQMMPYYKNVSDSQLYPISHGGDVSIPWYASSEGYGFVWNSPAFGTVNLSSTSLSWHSVAQANEDLWITTTPVDADPTASPYAALLSQYVDAVGHAPTMPFYSTGFIQCKDRYRNQTQLLEVARGYVSRGLPVAVIVVDWQHWVNQGDWSFNRACWPDPQGMYDELASLGIELMTTFWPQQTTASQHWQQFSGGRLLAERMNVSDPNGPTSLLPFENDVYLVDQTNPDARAATFDGFWEGYGRYGVHTIWLDAAEPERMDAGAMGWWRLAAGTDAEVGEAWIQQHVRSFADGFASKGIAPSEYFVLPRHAWAGSWRYSAGLWSGDIQSTFDELSLQVRVLQNVMMSGVALWTTDIGGYWDGNASDPVFQELIVRWFQFGAFCPLFRLHGHRAGGPPANECGPTNGDNEVWNLAPDAAHYEAITAVMRLRENLRGYVARINGVAAATGLPMVRPMFLQWPLDPGCAGADVEDQFMFGDDWLVAPVTTFGATNRSVYLPSLAGSPKAHYSWVSFWDQVDMGQGGVRITVPTTNLTAFPLFVLRPLPVPPAPVYGAAALLWSANRSDAVLCVSSQCTNDNQPDQEGAYVPWDGGSGVVATALTALPPGANGTVVIDGVAVPVAPLNLWFSFTHNDNYVATNSTPPDASYMPASGGVAQADGFVLASPIIPGSLPLRVFFKDYGGGHWDYATLAGDAAAAWAEARGYSYQWTTGWVLLQPPSS